MRRQFSKELDEDRDFEIGGEVFQFRYPHWEEMSALFDEDLEQAKEAETPSENGSYFFKNDTELAINRVNIFLADADQKKRWSTLVKRKQNPIPRHQIVQLYRWLVEVTSGRPTTQPSDSAPGAGETDTSSQAGSS